MPGSVERYAAFILTPIEGQCLGCEYQQRNDHWAGSVVLDRLGSQGGTILQKHDHRVLNAALHEWQRGGQTVRQI